MKEKLKSFLVDDSVYMASIVIGVGILAFFLGQLSVVSKGQQMNEAVNPLSLCPTMVCPTLVNPTAVVPTVQGQSISVVENESATAPYVASKAGSRYHHITCPGAKQIKEDNKIYFRTVQAAMAAGYSKAANCDK